MEESKSGRPSIHVAYVVIIAPPALAKRTISGLRKTIVNVADFGSGDKNLKIFFLRVN